MHAEDAACAKRSLPNVLAWPVSRPGIVPRYFRRMTAGAKRSLATKGDLNPPCKSVLQPAPFLWSPLIAQCVSGREQQVASEVVRGFAARLFDPMVAGVISELPVLEFSVAVLDNVGVNLRA